VRSMLAVDAAPAIGGIGELMPTVVLGMDDPGSREGQQQGTEPEAREPPSGVAGDAHGHERQADRAQAEDGKESHGIVRWLLVHPHVNRIGTGEGTGPERGKPRFAGLSSCAREDSNFHGPNRSTRPSTRITPR
jgi:hypothetical protein